MLNVISEPEGKKFPTLATFVGSRLPLAFLVSIRPLISSSYELAFPVSLKDDVALPYVRNLRPHDRNRLVFERMHEVAENFQLRITAKELNNGYFYPEIQSSGLTVHIKHRNNYQTLRDQMVKADYRKQMTLINLPFGQMPLELFGETKPTALPDQAYLLMFYEDGNNARTAGDIFFILPSNEEGNILASCSVEEVIAAVVPPAQNQIPAIDDEILLPPKNDSDEEERAQ